MMTMTTIDHAAVHIPQRQRVFSLLSDLDWHPFTELHRVGGIRYSARLLELKRLGYRIEDEPYGEDGKRYRLVSLEVGVPLPKRVKVFLTLHDARRLLDGVVTSPARTAVQKAVGSFQDNADKL
jgi:hypothetical protein